VTGATRRIRSAALRSARALGRRLVRQRRGNGTDPNVVFPLRPALPLPPGVSEPELFDFLKSVLVADAPVEEMSNYCAGDFRRFVYTYGLVANAKGRGLELGANPYFTTMLLREFTALDLTLANYFGPDVRDPIVQEVSYRDFRTGEPRSVTVESRHFNIEEDPFPFPDGTFDVVLFCEIIEHLLMDPVAVLRQIKRVLRPGGVLVLTTPNVSRLENVAKMIAGVNPNDQYSGYGPYGRHNREYNKHDLFLLLRYLGFEIGSMFTADVSPNHCNEYVGVGQLERLLRFRAPDLGQYIFVRASSEHPAGQKRPAFLYRSRPPEDLE